MRGVSASGRGETRTRCLGDTGKAFGVWVDHKVINRRRGASSTMGAWCACSSSVTKKLDTCSVPGAVPINPNAERSTCS